MLFEHRPPMIELQNGRLSGLMGSRAQQALDESGLSYALFAAPVQRQIGMVEQSIQPVCAVGRIKNAERMNVGRFSVPFYASGPYVAVVHKNAAWIDSEPSLRKWAQMPQLRWGVHAGFRYSEYISERLQSARARVLPFIQDNQHFSILVASRRIDFALMHEEEARYMLRTADERNKDLKSVALVDVLDGELRYFYCNRAVSPRTMQLLNEAIADQGLNSKRPVN